MSIRFVTPAAILRGLGALLSLALVATPEAAAVQVSINAPNYVGTGQQYDVSATASADGNLFSITLYKGDTPIAYDDVEHGGNSYEFTVGNPTSDSSAGQVTFTAVAWDTDGNPAVAEVTVTVRPRPTIWWTSPGQTNFAINTPYQVSASANSPDGMLAAVCINKNYVPWAHNPMPGFVYNGSSSGSEPGDQPGDFLYEAWAYDGYGVESEHIYLPVQVVNHVPIVLMSSSPYPVYIRTQYTISASATDEDNNLKWLRLYNDSGLVEERTSSGAPLSLTTAYQYPPALTEVPLNYWVASAQDWTNSTNVISFPYWKTNNRAPQIPTVEVKDTTLTNTVTQAQVGTTVAVTTQGVDQDTNLILHQIIYRWRERISESPLQYGPWSDYQFIKYEHPGGVGNSSQVYNLTLSKIGEYEIFTDTSDPYGTNTSTIRVTVTSTPPPPPGAPSGLYASNIFTDRITLNWTQPTPPGNGAVLFWKLSSAGSYQEIEMGVAEISRTVYSLQPGSSYDFHVKYYSNYISGGQQVRQYSGPSNTVTATTLATTGDADGDGLPNQWEIDFSLNPYSAADQLQDPDGDGWTNIAEYNMGRNPRLYDGSTATNGGGVDGAWPTGTTSDNVGATRGTPGVSPGGAAKYSIPLALAPGTKGMQPALSLEYSSQAGDGYLGWGWQLQGLSTISRGGATRALDGMPGSMRFASTDKYYLDGTRLVAINGSDGEAGVEYRTEIDTFTRVISYGTRGAGPDYFKAWTKSGLIMEFGAVDDARLHPGGKTEPLIWAVSKISDTSGNSIKISYVSDASNGELIPSQILYTCNSAAPNGYASVVFTLKNRTDPQSGYAYTEKIARTRLIDTITCYSSGGVYRRYTLGYQDGTADRPSLLTSLTESAHEPNASAAAFLPTTFNYYDVAPAGLNVEPIQAFDGAGVATLAADMDGDGLTDVVRIDNRNAAWAELYRNSGTSFYKNGETLMLSGADFPKGAFLTTDMDGDGLSEVIVNPAMAGISGIRQTRYYVQGLGSGGLAPYSTVPISNYAAMNLDTPMYSADITGDGRDDLIFIEMHPDSGPARVQILVSNGTSYSATIHNVGMLKNGLVTIGDATGDGLPDLVNVVDEANDRRIRVFTLAANAVTLADETSIGGKLPQWKTMLADVNGDGQNDLVYAYPSAALGGVTFTVAQVWLRKGNTFVSSGTQTLGGWNPEFQMVPFDYNGDRRTDIGIVFKPGGADRADLQIWRATGPDSQPFVAESPFTVSSSWLTTYSIVPAQLSRDGLGDLLYVSLATGITSQQTKFQPLLSKSSQTPEPGAYANMLWKATNGFGASVAFSYLSLLENSIYTKWGAGTYPNVNIRPAFRVVSRVTEDRPTGTATSIYSYWGLRVNAERGLQGFAIVGREDTRTGLRTMTNYYQDFPNTGLVLGVRVEDSATGQLVSEHQLTAKSPADYTAYFTPAGERRIYRPYIERTYSVQSDPQNYLSFKRSLATETRDQFGNVVVSYIRHSPMDVWGLLDDGQPLASGQFEQRISTSFDHDTNGENWLIARPTRVETYARSGHFASEGGSRVKSLSYWPGTSRVRFETEEPDAGQEYYRMVTEYGYDAYGNITTKTTSSPGAGDASIVARTTTYDYSATADHPVAGRYRNSEVDPLGQRTTFVYDQRLGLVRERRDNATGLTTYFFYDRFGQLTQETRPDGTITTITRRWDNTTVPYYGLGNWPVAKFHIDMRQSGGTPSLVRYDRFGYPIQTMTVAPNGVTLTSETPRDWAGRVSQESRPHPVGTSLGWTLTYYDRVGRMERRDESHPQGTATTLWTYDQLTSTQTDARGNKLKRTDNVLGLVERLTHNPDLAAGQPERGETFSLYDGFGQLRQASDAANNTVSYRYDRRGRTTEVDDPNRGRWTYTHYVNGLVRTQTDAKLVTTTFTYDLLDRAKDESVGNRVVHWDYNVATSTPLAGARETSAVTVTEAGAQIYSQTWSYDGFSRVSGTTRSFDGRTYASSQTYDAFGRPERRTYPSTESGSFATLSRYNSNGYLREVRRYDGSYSQGLGQIIWQAATYDTDGQLKLAYLGNGVSVDRMHYAENGLPQGDGISVNPSPAYAPATPVLLVQSYSWDKNKNLYSRGAYFSDPTFGSANYSETFTYDAMDRIQTVERPGVGVTHSYGYDATGNLTQKDGQTFSYVRQISSEPLAPHAIRSGAYMTYGYDANGNMQSMSAMLGSSSITWREFNLPGSISTQGWPTLNFIYGPNNERILQTRSDGTRVRYVDAFFEVTVPQGNASLTESRAYVFTPLGRTAIFQFNASGTLVSTRYTAQDQVDSVRLVTDEAGRVKERFAYDPWGGPEHPVNGQSTNWPTRQATSRGFSDHEMLKGPNLVHMNGRLYLPSVGRMLSPDPFIQEGYTTQRLNRYAYVANNPLTWSDPSGLLGETPSNPVPLPPVIVTSTPLPMPAWPAFSQPWQPIIVSGGLIANLSTGTHSQSSINQLAAEGQGFGGANVYPGFAEPEDEGPGIGDMALGAADFAGDLFFNTHGFMEAKALWEESARYQRTDKYIARATVLFFGVVLTADVVLNFFTGGGKSAVKGTGKALRRAGEDLFVGTYSKSYRANQKAGLNLTHTPHHSLQDAVSLTSHGRGITINLRKELHELTRTFRKPVESHLTVRQHLARDVVDLRNILRNAGYEQSLVNRQLQELIRQNKAIPGFPGR